MDSVTAGGAGLTAKGCLSNKTALAMIFKLTQAADRSWRRLNGHNQLPKMIQGVSSSTASKPSAATSSRYLTPAVTKIRR
jgi:murein endopeptidase